ncbi:guanine deaminase, partial [Acinetobacter baumannii]
MMDRNAPADLSDTAQAGYDESKALIARWHGTDRLTYVVSPRFAVTSTEAQLEAAGVLWKEHPDALMQTHVSENVYEI